MPNTYEFPQQYTVSDTTEIYILFMDPFSGFPPYSWNQVIVPGHQSARKNVLELFSQKSCCSLIHQTQPTVRKSLHLFFSFVKV